MKIKNYNETIPYIIIDDYYDEVELQLIWEELEFLSYPIKLKRATEKSGGAVTNGKLVKQNFHRYIDNIYSDRELSNILAVNRKLFIDDMGIMKQHGHWFFKNINFTHDWTQVGYYENNDNYGLHRDSAVITSLTWLHKEPKRYTGGNLFLDGEIEIECVNNRTLIFPSMITHEVTPVQLEEKYCNQRLGRYCISQFCWADMENH